MTITIEAIKAEQTKIAAMIAAFETQSSETTEIHFPEVLIELKHGEHYAGLITSKDGEASYHLILLPDQVSEITWIDAKAWAKDQGGELPTRREQSLLYANLKEEFEERYYWSNEQSASYSDCAWFTYFGNGGRTYNGVTAELIARAVRRLAI